MQVRKINNNTIAFTEPLTDRNYQMEMTGTRMNPSYEIKRYTKKGVYYFVREATELEAQLIKMFSASECRAVQIGANNMITSLGIRPEEDFPEESEWVIKEEGRDARGDYAVNYETKDGKYKATFYVQHSDQGRQVNFVTGQHFPITVKETHRLSEEYVNVLQLARYWVSANDSIVHIYVFYPSVTLDDILENDN